MRNRIVHWAGLACVAVVMACAGYVAPSVEAASFSWRFIGLNALRDKKDLVVLQQVTGLKEFEGFRSNLTTRVAATLAKPLAQGGANQTNLAKLLTPIASDLIAYPTIYEHETQGASNVWILAIQLPADRQEAWKSNWDAISKAVKISRQGDWTIVGTGPTKAVLEKTKKNSDDVLQINGDTPAIEKLLPDLKLGPSKTDLHVTVQGKNLRTEGKVQFEKDLPFKLTKWEIPTHTICEPLIGFTAMQGLRDYFSKLSAFKNQTAPNQVFFWSEDKTDFSSYLAAQVDNPQRFAFDLFENANLKSMTNLVGDFKYDTNVHGLYLYGLPVFVPFIRPAHTNDPNFVYTGLIPTAFATNGMPAELAREVTSRTNLVFYEWELAGGRLAQIRPISQAIAITTQKPISNFNTPADKWMIACESKLGNQVTELTRTSPRELTLVRRSDLGLSAVEFFEFVQWVAGPPGRAEHGGKKAEGVAMPPGPLPAPRNRPTAPR